MKILLPMILFMLAFGCSAPPVTDQEKVIDPPQATTSDTMIDALIGKWIDDQSDDSTVFHEHWSRLNDRSLEGLGFVMLKNDTVFIEHLGIHRTDTGTFYSAQIPAQNEGKPVYFKLTSTSDSLSFENPDHDFPQRIVYRPEGPTWVVDVSGREDGEARSMRFHLMPREEGPGSN